jgi:tRNA threonylcarbamoyl adenosine modification protein YjeE
MVTTETHSVAETEALGARLACALPLPALVLLSGELGAGKTAFVRGLLRGLSAPEDVVVSSPTYVLQHIYEAGRARAYHIDAYRLLGGGDEFEASGLRECFDDPLGLVCIEWPEKLGAFRWPREPVRVSIEHVDEQTRAIRIEGWHGHTV